jgi:undecaprenyl-diphosphatase
VFGGLVSLGFVAALGLKLQYVRGPVGIDTRAASHFVGVSQRLYQRDSGLRDLVQLGGEGPVTLSVLALAVWALKRRDVAGFLLVTIGPLSALFLAEAVLKPFIERRGASGALSYPSGHVTAVASVATAALLLVFRYAGPRWALVWSPLAAAVSATIAVAVIAAGWHYATDSVAGVALGAGVVCVVAAATDQLFRPT